VRSDPTGLAHPGLDTFSQHLTLKLCDCSKNLKSQPSRWQCRVEVLLQRNDVHSQCLALLGDGQQLSQRPRQPVQSPHDQHIEFLSSQPLQQIIQSRPTDLRTTLASIGEDLVLLSPPLSEFAELPSVILMSRQAEEGIVIEVFQGTRLRWGSLLRSRYFCLQSIGPLLD
jgi:hypothetical protein